MRESAEIEWHQNRKDNDRRARIFWLLVYNEVEYSNYHFFERMMISQLLTALVVCEISCSYSERSFNASVRVAWSRWNLSS